MSGMTTHTLRDTNAGSIEGRHLFSIVAVLGCVPYLILKSCWIAGVAVGWRDPQSVRAPGFVAGNLPTLAMDGVVVALAIIFITPVGRRLPGWLLLVPIWVGTGLLLPIPLVMGASALIAPAVGAGSVVANTAVADWVPVVVYGGFTIQATGLLGGFTLYARDRWQRILVLSMSDRRTDPVEGLLLVTARAGLAIAVGVAVGQLLVAFSGSQLDTRRAVIDRVSAVVIAALVVMGGAATVSLVSPRSNPERRLWPAMLIGWVGVAVLFSESLFGLAGELMATESAAGGVAPGLLDLAGLLGGTMLGLVAASALAGNAQVPLHQGTGRIMAVEEPLIHGRDALAPTPLHGAAAARHGKKLNLDGGRP